MSKRIGTHSGAFHCDEALACFMLLQTEAYSGATVVRTRDPALLAACDAVVDVGGEYDPSRHRFDHHQRGFGKTFSDQHDIKLSSAGLVYQHFGREVVRRVAGLPQDHPDLDEIFQRVYDKFVLPIDAIDNGVSMFDGEPRYKVRTGLSARVGALNPDWNERDVDPDERFSRAVALAGREFSDQVRWYARVWLPAREVVRRAYADRDGPVMVLSQHCPWAAHLRDMENERGDDLVLYVIWPDAASGTYRIRAVAKSAGSFENRKSLPESWRGKRGDALDAATGVPGGVFVHANGFIGGHQTLGGALLMARVASVGLF